jgi:hypothetical protein
MVRRVVCAKAVKQKKRWDELLDDLIDKHAGQAVTEEEADFIDVLLSVQDEYNLTRDNIKAILIVRMGTHIYMFSFILNQIS